MKITGLIVGGIILFLLAPALIVSFIKAPLGLDIKVMLFSAFLFMILISVLLFEVVEKLTSIQLFSRANFIANETKRLNPDSNQTAMNILKSDLNEELQMSKLSGELMGGMSTAKQWLIVLILQGGLVYFIFHLWPQA